jgi:prepilin-type N-terminal cleavage/methylation domain-containing protein
MKLGMGNTAGFTIVEVMIVLAVTSLIFLIAAQATGGQIEKATFKSGMSQMASALQDSIEQVEDGSYSNVSLPKCIAPLSANLPIRFSGANFQQGNNSSCVFAGTMYQFVPSGAAGSYELYSLAAARNCTNTQPLTLYCIPASSPFEGSGIGLIPNLTVQTQMPEDLSVAEMGYTDAVSGDQTSLDTATGGDTGPNVLIGFVENFGLGSGAVQSGSQGRPYIVYVSAPDSWDSSSVQTNVTPQYLGLASEACIGLTDGTQYADIEIGGSGSDQLSVSITYTTQAGAELTAGNQCGS